VISPVSGSAAGPHPLNHNRFIRFNFFSDGHSNVAAGRQKTELSINTTADHLAADIQEALARRLKKFCTEQRECAFRWRAAGREVIIEDPASGRDLNDELRGAAA
jgi:hypothetical protein